MMDFEQINDMVSESMQDNRVRMPDGLALAEQVAWQGLVYLYTWYRMGQQDRGLCVAIKGQMRAEYQTWVNRFEQIDEDMSCALAMWKLAGKHPDVSAAVLRDMALRSGGAEV